MSVFPPYRGAKWRLCSSSFIACSGCVWSMPGIVAAMSSRLRPWYIRASTLWMLTVQGFPSECMFLVSCSLLR